VVLDSPGGGCVGWKYVEEEMNFNLTNIFMGFLAGLCCALGGALKDCPFEGFSRVKFMRSPIVATLFGCVSGLFTVHPVMAFMFAGYAERLAIEGWKILRARTCGPEGVGIQQPGKFALRHPSLLGRVFNFRKLPEEGEV
jgi:hypothetical protein